MHSVIILGLAQIVDFDAKAETLSTLMWPLVCWHDINIHWDPTQNDGTLSGDSIHYFSITKSRIKFN